MLLGTGRNIAFGTDEDHARHRRALNYAMSDRVFQEQETLMTGYVDMLIDKIAVFAKKGEKVDTLTWVSFVTFDIVSEFALGKSYNMRHEGKWNPWAHNIFNSLETAMLSAVIQQFFQPIFPLLMAMAPKKVFEPMRQHQARTFECVDERLAKGITDRKDMWVYILANNDNENLRLSGEEMRGLAMGVLMAGTETVASGVTGVIWGLFNTPTARRKL